LLGISKSPENKFSTLEIIARNPNYRSNCKQLFERLTIKKTYCIHRQDCAGRWTVFIKINFALEELRQVDFARYIKISKAPLLLLSLPFFSLLNYVAVACISLFSTQLGKHQNSVLALSIFFMFSTGFEKFTSHCSTSVSSFRWLMFKASSLFLFQSNWLHRDQLKLFQ